MSTDTFTAKFSLTSDFQTIQWLRRTLADQLHQTQLCSLLSDTLSTYLANLAQSELTVQTSLRISKERSQRSGSRLPTPLCQSGQLTWYDPEADRTNFVAHIGTTDFVDALRSQAFNSFRYFANPQTSISIFRRSDGKWYAAKRINGKLKRRYLVLPENITLAKLNQITADLLKIITIE